MKFWLWVQKDKLFVRSFRNKYEIDNKSIVERMCKRFPDLSALPMVVGKEEMYEDSQDQQLDRVCKKIYQAVNNANKKYDPTPKVQVKDLCVYSHKNEMIQAIEDDVNVLQHVIFPVADGSVAMCGSKEDVIHVITELVGEEVQVLSPEIISLAKAKARQLEMLPGIISFVKVGREAVVFSEKYMFRNNDVASVEDEEHFESISLEDSNNINKELNVLNELLVKLDHYFGTYGFESYHQIPFKISCFKYFYKGNVNTTISTGTEPGEVYVRSIKLGIEDFLNEYNHEEHSRWVMAQTGLDIMLEGVLPVIFEKLIDENSLLLQRQEINIFDNQNVVFTLIHRMDEEFLEDIKIDCFSLKNCNLKKCILTKKSDSDVVIEGYGIDIKTIISSLMIRYYALTIQNKKYFDHSYSNKVQRIGNDLNLHGDEEKKLTENIKREVGTILSRDKDYQLKLINWKYNYLLDKTQMKCIKVIYEKIGKNKS